MENQTITTFKPFRYMRINLKVNLLWEYECHAARFHPHQNKDSVKFTAAMVDNKRDPSCGMPVAAGIGDTAHCKGKILGFCSKECKDEFLKDPTKNISAAHLK